MKLSKTAQTTRLLRLRPAGWPIGIQKDPADSLRLIQAALDYGMHFLDNSPDYNDGPSEIQMGQAIKGRRQKMLLSTKFNSRDKKGALRELEQSLRRLQAAALAQKQGKAWFVGFTGHKHPDYQLGMLNKPIPWDTLPMPVHGLDGHFRSFEKLGLPEPLRPKLGIIGMKPMAFKNALQTASATECLRYALSLPVSVLITGCQTLERIAQPVTVGRRFKPMRNKESNALVARTKAFGQTGQGEPIKLTTDFDNKPSATPLPYRA